MADNGTAPLFEMQALDRPKRKALTSREIGTGFDPLHDRLFLSFDGGKVFDYGDTQARDYQEMLDRDGKARGIEQALTLPLRSAPSAIHPAQGDRGEADFVTEVLAGMSTPMPLVIGQMTGAVTFRKSYHEKVWRLDDAGRVVYEKLAWRPPATCELARDATTAAFRGFRQRQWWVGTAISRQQTSNLGYVDIPPQRSFVYLHGQHRDPLRGASDLEVSRWCHETRQKILFIWFQYLERQALPWTVVYGTSPDNAEERAEQVAEVKSGGVVGLQQPQQPGQRAFDVIDTAGQGAAQFRDALAWLDGQMSMSVLAGWMDLTGAAAAGRGSFALSADQTELFMQARRSVLDEMATTINQWLLRPLVVYNFGPGAAVPEFKFGPVSEQGAAETIQILQAVAAAPKLNLPASFVEELMVRAAGLLDLDVDKVRKDAAAAAQRAVAQADTPQLEQLAPVKGAVDAVARAAAAGTPRRREPVQQQLPLPGGA